MAACCPVQQNVPVDHVVAHEGKQEHKVQTRPACIVLGKRLLSSLVEKNPSVASLMMAIIVSTWLQLGLIPCGLLTLSQRLLRAAVLKFGFILLGLIISQVRYEAES